MVLRIIEKIVECKRNRFLILIFIIFGFFRGRGIGPAAIFVRNFGDVGAVVAWGNGLVVDHFQLTEPFEFSKHNFVEHAFV